MSFRKPATRPVETEGEQQPRPRRPKTPEEQREALLAYAFRALGARALSGAELRTKLERRSDDAELIEAVLARVQELGYQRDEQVAHIESARRGVGQFRVRQTLRRRGLESELIEQTIGAIDPDDERAAAVDLLTRRWAGLARKRDPRASAYALLARRGYPSNIIWAVIKEVAELHPPDEADEAGDEAGGDGPEADGPEAY